MHKHATTQFLTTVAAQLFFFFLSVGLSGWWSVRIQLQPGYKPRGKGGHLCFEQNLFSLASLGSKRGYLWGELHGSKPGYIIHVAEKGDVDQLWLLCRYLWRVKSHVHLRLRKKTGMLLSLYVVSHSGILIMLNLPPLVATSLCFISRPIAPPPQTGRWCFREQTSSWRRWPCLKLASRATCSTWRLDGLYFVRRMDSRTHSLQK